MAIITGPRAGKVRIVEEQPLRWGRNEGGNYSVRSFEGTKAEITAQAGWFARFPGVLYEVEELFGKSHLTVHVPWGPYGVDPRTDRIDNWELFANIAESDLLAAQTNTKITDTLSDKQVSKLRILFQNGPPDPLDPNYPKGAADFTFKPDDSATAANAYNIFLRMMKGTKAYLVQQPALRHTITVNANSTVKASLSNVGKLLTGDAMLISEGTPPALLFDMPQDPDPGDPALKYGWYKHYPTIQEVALSKWNIVQEFSYGLWDTIFYGLPITVEVLGQ